MKPVLTPKDFALLRRLINSEAQRMGYGTTYTDTNRNEWPAALTRLQRVAGRLRALQWDS